MYPGDGTITIPPFTLHEYGRADGHKAGISCRTVDLKIREWTSPPDRAKEIFFRNMLGLIMDQPKEAGLQDNIKTLLALFVVMKEHDNYPLIWKGPSLLGESIQASVQRNTTYLIQGAIAWFGSLCGFRGTYEEYTPQVLLNS